MKALILFVFTSLPNLSIAQSPVKWEYSAKKIAEKIYEVHLTVIIDNGWHTFSQIQPEDAIAMPTTVSFNKNPLVQLKGKINELGKMEKLMDETTGIEQWQYSEKVDFVQKVVVMGTSSGQQVRTSISGNITFQICNDHECMPPKTERFTIKIGD